MKVFNFRIYVVSFVLSICTNTLKAHSDSDSEDNATTISSVSSTNIKLNKVINVSDSFSSFKGSEVRTLSSSKKKKDREKIKSNKNVSKQNIFIESSELIEEIMGSFPSLPNQHNEELKAYIDGNMRKLMKTLQAKFVEIYSVDTINILLHPRLKEIKQHPVFKIESCHEDCSKKVILLALDGGGIRGIAPAYILTFLENLTGKKIHELFDIIGGTSTGGLIAAAIGLPNADNTGARYTAKEIMDFYIEDKELIFHKSIRSLDGIAKSKYKSSSLKKFIKNRFTNNYKLTDMILPTVLIGYNCTERSIKLFSSMDAYLDDHVDYPLHKATLASAAAPTYFKAVTFEDSVNAVHKKKKSEIICDGGLIANNPSEEVLEAAHKLFPNKKDEDFILLSLGTGKPIHTESEINPGKLSAPNLVKRFKAAPMALVDRHMKERLGDNYIRIQIGLEKETKLDNVEQKSIKALIKAVCKTLEEDVNARAINNLYELWALQNGKHGSSYDSWQEIKRNISIE
jgi:uncharacterized protein